MGTKASRCLGDQAPGGAGKARQSQRRALPGLPIGVRLHGKTRFSFTWHLACPYDPRMSRAIVSATAKLAEESGAVPGFTLPEVRLRGVPRQPSPAPKGGAAGSRRVARFPSL